MNNCFHTRKLNRLLWIENQGYWVYQCLLCGKEELEKQSFVGDQKHQAGGFYEL